MHCMLSGLKEGPECIGELVDAHGGCVAVFTLIRHLCMAMLSLGLGGSAIYASI